MKRKQLLALAACLLLILPAAQGFAAEDAYRASQYFERGYSAYASAVRLEGDRYLVDVYLQLAAEIPPHAGIASYTVYANDVPLTVLPPGQNVHGVTLPGFFGGEIALTGTPTSLVVVPTLLEGGEAREEAVNLMPEKGAGSRVGATAVVNNPNPEDRLNLRVAPSSQASSLRHYFNGVEVLVLNECDDNWVSVCIGTNYGMARGYMKADFLAFGADIAGVAPMSPTETAEVASWTLYALPDEAATTIGTYGAGQAYRVLGESTAWQHILVDRQAGFVRAGAIAAREEAQPMPLLDATDTAGEADATGTQPPYLEADDGTRMIVYHPPGAAPQP